MSIFSQSGVSGLERLIWWNIILYWNSKLHLIKNMDQIKIVQNSISYKNWVDTYVYLSQEWK